jgi:tetratricopeptide (TPR) repeat protein
VLGPDHTYLSVPLTNIGLGLGELGRYADALSYLTRALALDEKAFGKTSADLGIELWGIGDALDHLGRHGEAIATLERALALDNAAAAEEPYRNAQLSLAIALGSLQRDRARAVKLATEARAGFAKLGLKRELAKADRWLAAHR